MNPATFVALTTIIIIAVLITSGVVTTILEGNPTRPNRTERRAARTETATLKHRQTILRDAENHLAMSMDYTTKTGDFIPAENLHHWILHLVDTWPHLQHDQNTCFTCFNKKFLKETQEPVQEKTPNPVPEKTPDDFQEKRSEENADNFWRNVSGSNPEKTPGPVFWETTGEKRPTIFPENRQRYNPGGPVYSSTIKYSFPSDATDEEIIAFKSKHAPIPETMNRKVDFPLEPETPPQEKLSRVCG